MAKVKGTDGRASTKRVIEEPIKSNTKLRSKSKSTVATKVAEKSTKKSSNKDPPKQNATRTVNADVDSGISSPEWASRSRNSDKRLATTKISKKSKTAISKPKNKNTVTTSVVKKLSDIDWMKGLIQEQSKTHPKKRRLVSGIEARFPGSITLREDKGVEYLMFPWTHGKCGGYVRMRSGCQKAVRKSASTIHFVILLGKVELLAGSKETEFKSGAMITIPKGVHYGLKNSSRETTFLRFQTINGEE